MTRCDLCDVRTHDGERCAHCARRLKRGELIADRLGVVHGDGVSASFDSADDAAEFVRLTSKGGRPSRFAFQFDEIFNP